ncbi:hypothetical protein GGS21DRAFT_114264 [Xylaria nigripes]|nr:hypothetical protein GGS21DRAFT_114264 [Xylaria nigripes]
MDTAPTKRKRVLLSCHACRASKLRCDRADPCGQCLKRGKQDSCVYAPRADKHRPPRSMAARLKRLEGMVRGMAELNHRAPDSGPGDGAGPAMGGSVIHGERATNFVGGTHFMAILEDLEDLKAYFEDVEGPELNVEEENMGPDEVLIFPRGAPGSREELLALLPDKGVMDRLMSRYFNSNSPSQHIVHAPTFTKQYNQFLQNRKDADIHWIATLFMILGLGIFFSSFQTPHELELDSSMPAMDKFRKYRGACGWALVSGKYSQPGPFTLQALLLYTEAEFLFNGVSQTNCYLLCSILIRLMLKLGLHRDPSKLPGITPYQGEMRRRMWNLAVQIDLLVSFHLGLPCMIHGIESDCALPGNLLDSDFGENSTDLPPSRPSTEYTPLSYPINKSMVARGFGLVARLSHSLTLPTYAEIMRVDARIREVWSAVPAFLRIKPLSESITDPPMLVIQRFGLATLYQKSRCVLHRRLLVDSNPLKEHDYSRRSCLEAAVALLEYQSTMYEATKPGAIIAQNRWFIASLAINDFLLADMVVALTVQQLDEGKDGLEWIATCTPHVTKTSLIEMLEHSYFIWTEMGATVANCRKAATVVRKMLLKTQTQLDETPVESDLAFDNVPAESSSYDDEVAKMTLGSDSFSQLYNEGNVTHEMGPSTHEFMDFGMAEPIACFHDPATQQHMANPWGMPPLQSGYDWDQFDAFTRGPTDGGTPMPQVSQLAVENWPHEDNFDDLEHLQDINSWNAFFGIPQEGT